MNHDNAVPTDTTRSPLEQAQDILFEAHRSRNNGLVFGDGSRSIDEFFKEHGVHVLDGTALLSVGVPGNPNAECALEYVAPGVARILVRKDQNDAWSEWHWLQSPIDTIKAGNSYQRIATPFPALTFEALLAIVLECADNVNQEKNSRAFLVPIMGTACMQGAARANQIMERLLGGKTLKGLVKEALEEMSRRAGFGPGPRL